MKEVVIVDGLRSPIGSFGGSLKNTPNQDMGGEVVRALLEKSGLDPGLVEEVIFGCVSQHSDAINIARVIGLTAGISVRTPAYTVQRNCSSGLQAVVNAFQNIQCGDADIQIAGGVENMSRTPYISRETRWGQRLRHTELIDSLWESLTDGFCGLVMGQTAENLAEEFKISREEQDRFAAESHQKAVAALNEKRFVEEIVPIRIKKPGSGQPGRTFSVDEAPDAEINAEALARLRPIFKKEGGSVTAGNACPLNDGAAALLVMSAGKARDLGYEALGAIRSYGFAGVEPERMGIGPAHAIPKALEKGGLKLEDVDLFEINEAFAVQYLSVERSLKINRDIVNVNGGAIALGHPVGMTGARLILAILRELERRDKRFGVASMCVGGGMGAAMVLERKSK